MNIWQLSLIILSSLKLGASLYKDLGIHLKPEDRKSDWTALIASILVYASVMFIYYKAGVLVL